MQDWANYSWYSARGKKAHDLRLNMPLAPISNRSEVAFSLSWFKHLTKKRTDKHFKICN